MDGIITSNRRIGIQIDADLAKDSSLSSSPFNRKIEFHPARKPFTGFINSSTDFSIETLNPSSDSKWQGSTQGQSVMRGKKPDGTDFLENGLDPELNFGITVRKIGAGLENLGNTCFLNSVLQCLTYTEPLAAYLQSGKHRSSCHIAGFCALCAIQKHVSRALQASGRSLAPKDLVSNLRCISRSFRNARQEDAHEYMVNLLESMHKCCLPSGVPSESPSAYDKSLVHKIFGGRLRSQVKCTQCSHGSNKFDPFLDLSLEIVKADSLQKAFTQFTAPEMLDGGNKEYRCERCKQKVRALKQLTVDKTPNVLTIHLKRFRAHDPGKINKKVQFGPTLDMKPFVSGSHEGELKYTLYGVLVHYGWSIHSGHYFCFVRTSSGMWHSLDDNRVVQVSERTVLEQKAYMLFYVRDRKTVVPKKSIEAVQKEIMKANGAMKTTSIPPQISSERLPNGLAEGKVYMKDSLAVMTQKDAINGCSSKGTPVKVESAVEPTISAPLPKGPSEVSVQQSVPCLNKNANSSTLEDIPTSMPTQTGQSNIDSDYKKSFQPPSTVSPNCGSPRPCTSDKPAFKETLQKVSDTNFPDTGGSCNDKAKEISNRAPSGGSCKNNKPSCENSQVVATTIVNISNSSEMAAPDCSPRKSKKKVIKCPVKNVYIGLKFFRVSLGLRKKANHKRSKQRALDITSLSKDLLFDQNNCLSDLGPSTSETHTLGSNHSKRKFDNGTSRKKSDKSNDDSLMGETVKRSNEGTCKVDSVLDVSLDSQNSSAVLEARQQDGAEPVSSKDNPVALPQSEVMRLPTGGLKEPVVGRWDDIELPPKIIQSKSKTVTIGYEGDEWDEEYDRGKRKKIKFNQHSFDGTNLFQDIATEKLKSKKAKFPQSSTRDIPFRI